MKWTKSKYKHVNVQEKKEVQTKDTDLRLLRCERIKPLAGATKDFNKTEQNTATEKRERRRWKEANR